MTKLDVLIKARKLLSDPRRWTKGDWRARNSEVDGGFCYCALGAIAAAAGAIDARGTVDHDDQDYQDSAFVLSEQITESITETVFKYDLNGTQIEITDPIRRVYRFNDSSSTTYEDVLKVFSDAIQAEVNAPVEEQVAA